MQDITIDSMVITPQCGEQLATFNCHIGTIGIRHVQIISIDPHAQPTVKLPVQTWQRGPNQWGKTDLIELTPIDYTRLRTVAICHYQDAITESQRKSTSAEQ
jgi:hypothetical protein